MEHTYENCHNLSCKSKSRQEGYDSGMLNIVSLVNENVEDLLNKSTDKMSKMTEDTDKHQEVIFRTCLQFTKAYINELYVNICKGNEK